LRQALVLHNRESHKN